MEKPRAKPRRANESGPVGERTAKNLQQLRESSRLSQDDLAAAVTRLGRPMTRQIVSKCESGDRRIDVDDLVAFALALRAAPNRLLLNATARADHTIGVTPDYEVSEFDAWMWGLGERPLDRGFDAPQLQLVLDVDRRRWFVRENRPTRLREHPLGPMDPEVMKAIRKVVRETRRSGEEIQSVHEALQYAFLFTEPEDDESWPE